MTRDLRSMASCETHIASLTPLGAGLGFSQETMEARHCAVSTDSVTLLRVFGPAAPTVARWVGTALAMPTSLRSTLWSWPQGTIRALNQGA